MATVEEEIKSSVTPPANTDRSRATAAVRTTQQQASSFFDDKGQSESHHQFYLVTQRLVRAVIRLAAQVQRAGDHES